jgi:hypothetical protein
MRKRLLAAATVATIGVAGVTSGAAFAVTQADGSTDPMSSLVTAIAEKFDLKTSDVQAVFDEQRTKMEAEREQETKDKVAALVTESKLTQAQADKINAKRAELKEQREAERDSMQDKTAEERRSAMETKRTELDTWLEENDIDKTYAYLLMGGHGHGGPGGPGGPREENTSTESEQ